MPSLQPKLRANGRNIVALALTVVIMAACASSSSRPEAGAAGPGATRTLNDLVGASIAMPIGLFLTSLDTDRDMFVSRAEARDGATATYSAGDENGDGRLSPIEFEDWSLSHLGARQTVPGRLQFDRNFDGFVSPEEFSITLDALHQGLDADADGRLARAELLVQISGAGFDQAAMRAEMEAEMRRQMEGRIRELCQRGRGS